MERMRRAPEIRLTNAQRQTATEKARSNSLPERLKRRYQIILLADEGEQDINIAARLSVGRQTVALWRRRFLSFGLVSLEQEREGRGRKPKANPELREEIVRKQWETMPNGKRWSSRQLASVVGISATVIRGIWMESRMSSTGNRSAHP